MTCRGAIYAFDMACQDPNDSARIRQIQDRAADLVKRLREHIGQFVTVQSRLTFRF